MALFDPEFLELSRDFDANDFWQENDFCNSAHENKPRVALIISPDDHWLFEFLDVQSTVRYYRNKSYRDDLHRQANALMRERIGRAYFDKDTWETSPKRIENLFGAEFEYHEGGTPWFVPATDDLDEFQRVLDRAEKCDLKSWALPDDFLREWKKRSAQGKPLPKLGTGSRGPATVMTSVLAPETLFFWMLDEPHIIERFRDLLAQKYIELNQVLRDFSSNTDFGWWITDDNCALFNVELYDNYCVPVLKRVLETFAPGDARRYQHSDSNMAHLLDAQRELGINHVNYGPEIDVALIRRKMPAAIIDGHTPPFLLRNGTPQEIENRVRDDFEKVGRSGKLQIATAGSLAAGTSLERVRFWMQCVEKHCRYD
jgi:uroporphyrinogen decarboxylase